MSSRRIFGNPPIQNHGWMDARAITDLDGHLLEAVHSAESRPPEGMQERA